MSQYSGISFCDGHMPVELEDIKTLSEADAALNFVIKKTKELESSIVTMVDDIIEMVEEDLEESDLTSRRIDDIFNHGDPYLWYHCPFREYSSLSPSWNTILNPAHTRNYHGDTQPFTIFGGLIGNTQHGTDEANGWRDAFKSQKHDVKRHIIIRAAVLWGYVVGGKSSTKLRSVQWAPGRDHDTSEWTITTAFQDHEQIDTLIDFGIMLLDLRKAMDRLGLSSPELSYRDPRDRFTPGNNPVQGSGILSDRNNGSEASLPMMASLISRKYGEMVTNSKDIRGSIVYVWNSRRSIIGQVVNGRGNQLYIKTIDPVVLALVSPIPVGREADVMLGRATALRLEGRFHRLQISESAITSRDVVTDLLLSEAMDDRLAINNLVNEALCLDLRQWYMPWFAQSENEDEWRPHHEEMYGKNSVIQKFSLATSRVAVLLPKAESERAMDRAERLSSLLYDWKTTYKSEHQDAYDWAKAGGKQAVEHQQQIEQAAAKWIAEISKNVVMATELAKDDEDSADGQRDGSRLSFERLDFYRRLFVKSLQWGIDNEKLNDITQVGIDESMVMAEKQCGPLSEEERKLIDTKPEGVEDMVAENYILSRLLDRDDDFIAEISAVLGRDVSLSEDSE